MIRLRQSDLRKLNAARHVRQRNATEHQDVARPTQLISEHSHGSVNFGALFCAAIGAAGSVKRFGVTPLTTTKRVGTIAVDGIARGEGRGGEF